MHMYYNIGEPIKWTEVYLHNHVCRKSYYTCMYVCVTLHVYMHIYAHSRVCVD